VKVRAGQAEFERGVDRHRIAGFLTRRQYGKTTLAARIALKKMMRTAGHTVVFGSVKLDLGREIVRKESEAIHRAVQAMADGAMADQIRLVDSKTGKAAPVGDDDFADVYEAQRLEFRLYHSRSVYSRTKVVALTQDAVGETGDLILDEVGRVKNFRSVWEAVKPIISSQPSFRCILTTTPPPDDSHYSFELLAPPVREEFPVRPEGNWYRSDLGVQVLRVTAYDAHADGIPLYDDDTGKPISPEDSRRKDPDKDAWDRNYAVMFVFGGTAACGLLALNSAQSRGIGICRLIVIDVDSDVDDGLAWLREHLGPGPVGLGLDLATTESESSNPTSITVMERSGSEFSGVLTLVWKTRDPAIATDRIRRTVQAVRDARPGNPPRRLAIDATSERYFAVQLQRELAPLIPVELVISSETVEQPGGEKITKKALLGSQYIAELDDNHLTLAPDRYLRDDHRLVRTDRGSYTTTLGPNGEHGDTFDSHKLALHALTSTSGALEGVTGIRMGRPSIRRPTLGPRLSLHR
jgi:hypothetical protein